MPELTESNVDVEAEELRHRFRDDKTRANYADGWLTSSAWRQHTGTARPSSERGRVFVDFKQGLRQALSWPTHHKSSVFNEDLG